MTDCTIFPEQRATAVYATAEGICIEQEGDTVTIAGPNVVGVLYALIDAADLPMEIIERVGCGYADVERPDLSGVTGDSASEPELKDRTAAARQRRYRQRKRNANRNGERNANRNAQSVTPLLAAE